MLMEVHAFMHFGLLNRVFGYVCGRNVMVSKFSHQQGMNATARTDVQNTFV